MEEIIPDGVSWFAACVRGVEVLSVVYGAKFDYGYEPNAGALGGFWELAFTVGA
jgi:hypothetical protein